MPERDKPHLIIRTPAHATPYQPPNRTVPTPPLPVPDDRRQHGQQLRGDLQQVEADAVWRRQENPTRDHSANGARYSLVVSIETPQQDVDIWTPVAQQIGIPIAITIPT